MLPCIPAAEKKNNRGNHHCHTEVCTLKNHVNTSQTFLVECHRVQLVYVYTVHTVQLKDKRTAHTRTIRTYCAYAYVHIRVCVR